MYTVLILNKKSSDLLTEYKFLYTPFINNGNITICDWNESGTDVDSAVPDLYKVIKGKKNWRAIIVCTDSIIDYKDSWIPDEQNPFDYSKHFSDEIIPTESEIPLIRLTHILGGFQKTPVKEFEKAYEYVDKDGNVKKIIENNKNYDEIYALHQEYGEQLKPVYVEKKVDEKILKAYELLHNKYSFTDNRPSEIVLISTRKHIDDNEKEKVVNSWKNQLEMESSSFWKNNRYPTNCRFLYYEVVNHENTSYVKDMTEFWLSVLTMAVNKIQASSLQAYRLYQLKIEVSRERLSEILNSHIDKMSAAYAATVEQLNSVRDNFREENEPVLTKQPVNVIIQEMNTKSVYINASKIGLSRDCPEDERNYWERSVRASKEAWTAFLKAPKREIDRAAEHMKRKSKLFYGDEYELDRYQISDLREQCDFLEDDIISSDTKDIMNTKKLQEDINQIDREVRKTIAYRMRRKTCFTIGLIILLIYFLGFIPYLQGAYHLKKSGLPGALGITFISIFLVGLGGLTALFILRKNLSELIKKYNQLMNQLIIRVNLSAAKFSKYFTDICTYMKGQSIFAGMELKKDSVYNSKQLLRTHKRALKASIARDSEWLTSYDIARVAHAEKNVSKFFDSDIVPQKNGLYYFKENIVDGNLPINNTGDFITAPYDFISKIEIIREDIFDEEV